MGTFNKVLIFGRLGADPEWKESKNGKHYARLSLATDQFFKTATGEFERTTDWHGVQVWGPKAEICARFLKKGVSVLVEGTLSTFEVPDGENTRKITTIRASDVVFNLPRKEPENPELT